LERDEPGAEAAYRQAIALNPNLPEAHFGLVMLLTRGNFEIGDEIPPTEEALAALQKGVRLDPMSSGVHDWLGDMLLQLGKLEEAEAEYTIAVQLQPTSGEARIALGDLLAQVGRHEEAVPLYEQTLSLQPRSPRSRRAAARIAGYKALLGRPDEAIEMYQSQLDNETNPNRRANIQGQIAGLYLELNDDQTTSEMLNAIGDSRQNFVLTDIQIHLAMAQGRYEDLETLIHEWRTTTDPLKFVLPAYEIVIGHDDHARELLEETSSDREPAAIQAAYLYLKSGDADTAAVLLDESRQALASDRVDRYAAGGAYYRLASGAAIEGRTEEALNLLEEAIASGWTSHWYAPRDPYLESLWDEPRFQTLIADLKSEMDRLRLTM
jgi:tetratricopeptide (TPR) repeat protein